MNTYKLKKYNMNGKSLKAKVDIGLMMVSPTGIEPVTISLIRRWSQVSLFVLYFKKLEFINV